VFALDFLRLGLAHFVLLCLKMSLVGPSAIGIQPCDAKPLQQGCELHKDRILPPPKDMHEYFPTAMINRVPQPSRVRFLPNIPPHLIEF
jgi:hypothetical protein